MKYFELPRQEYLYNLTKYTFSSMKLNRAVFDFFEATKKDYEFLYAELRKIDDMVDITQDEKLKLKDTLSQTDIDTSNFKPFELKLDDFNDDVCKMPRNNTDWLSMEEIIYIIKVCKLINESNIKTP